MSLKERAKELYHIVLECNNAIGSHETYVCSEVEHILEALQQTREEAIRECAEEAGDSKGSLEAVHRILQLLSQPEVEK